MKKFFCILSYLLLFSFLFFKNVLAVENPFSVLNNKFGVHVLFPEELDEATDIVNSNGGDWGYVTIPIQAGDKNLIKWQKFMDSARKNHIIPIIRLATEGDYFNTQVWRKPNELDLLDFANFLNALEWPTKNRYIVIFNEVNRFDEWGGEVNPKEYSHLLEYAATIFKSKNQDFFVISAGLDNAADGDPKYFMNQYDFMKEMNNSVPGIFNQVDGLASHSYPNPAFSQPPSFDTQKSITSFRYEKELVEQISSKNLPIFITETGWSLKNVREEQIASYFKEAFGNVWKDENIIAVTPFILRAGDGSFAQFSLINKDNRPSLVYKALQDIPKEEGRPILFEKDNKQQKRSYKSQTFPVKDFKSSYSTKNRQVAGVSDETSAIKTIFKWLVNL